mgnify:CR=1 FL=1
MENLHLSYDEVVYKIPYRNLIVMQKDKLHVAAGDVVKEVDDEKFFSMMGQRNFVN